MFNPDEEVLYGMYETIEKMITDRRIRFQIDQQLNRLKAQWLFGRNMAIDTRDKKQPGINFIYFSTFLKSIILQL